MPVHASGERVDALIRWLDVRLERFRVERAELSLRDRVLRLVEARKRFQQLGVATVAEIGIDGGAARTRIRQYLVAHCGIPVAGAELAVVGGISAFARRIRELRVEEGYLIASSSSSDPIAGAKLKRGEYLLAAPDPDKDAARRWHIANRTRRMRGGHMTRMLAFLKENVGRPVSTAELSYVAKAGAAFTRRVRQLRTERGYAISTRFTGRPQLPPATYVLEAVDPVVPPHDRRIKPATLLAVYKRDGTRCTRCGWDRALESPTDRRYLEVHHVKPHAQRGGNVLGNLAVICNRCHDLVHADSQGS